MKRFLIAGTFRARCRGQVLAAEAPMPGTSRLPPVYGGADRQLTDLYIGVDGGGAFCDSNWIDRSNAPRAISSAVELFGGTVKANYQTGRWVFDVEGSWDWTNFASVGGNSGSSQVELPLLLIKLSRLASHRLLPDDSLFRKMQTVGVLSGMRR
jgi:hypothetical protein